MFGNQYRYAIEVADEETGIYVPIIIVNEPYDLINLDSSIKTFRIVTFAQDTKEIYHRKDFIVVDLNGLSEIERKKELTKQLNLTVL